MNQGGKYGNGLGHGPRCACPDCSASFLEHNRNVRCACMDCTYHREIGAPQPPVVPQPNRYDTPPTVHVGHQHWEVGKTYTVVPPIETRNKPSLISRIVKGAKNMGNLNMCERPGCNAFIRGEALGYVDVLYNTKPKTERVVTELCPACMADVHALLSSEPVTGRERGYDKEKAFVPTEKGDDVTSASDEQLAAELFQRMMAKARLQIEDGKNGAEG